MVQRTPADDAFGAEVVRVHAMDPEPAERRLWEMHAEAVLQGRSNHAWMCLSELRMLIDSEGRTREALRLSIRLVREHFSAHTLTSLGYGLERYGWVRFARRFFERALEVPDPQSSAVNWHEHAQAGLVRMNVRLKGGWPYPHPRR